MIFLIDHNLEGHALLLAGILDKELSELLAIRFVRFDEIGLSIQSSDREVWHFAQTHQMILLTANRSRKGEDSLEQVMREENTPTSLPIVTVGNSDRLLFDSDYRERCADSLIEIVFDIENYKGVGRLFIPRKNG